MREIGTIARESDAKALADYLLTLDITTKIVAKAAGGWTIWVHREDRVSQAREVLDEFALNPSDARFQAASKVAKDIRKKSEKVDKAYRKRTKDFRERWEGAMYHRAPLAFGLIVVSVIVTALLNVGFWDEVDGALRFSVEAFDLKSLSLEDTGFAAIQQGQVWRLLTPIFLHFGIAHLFFNMMGMRYLGERVEMRKGTWRFLLIVLVSGIGGNVGQWYVSEGNFGGMSGVIFALAGYLWIKGHTDPGDHLSLDQRSVNWMIGWFLLGILAPMTVRNGEVPHGFPYNMANVAHGVGLVVGMIFGILRF